MKGVLFLCVHNAGRSQMAAGFMRTLGTERVKVFSADSEPASLLNPVAVAAMSEVGIDISSTQPQRWTIADPADADLAVVRQIRDQIRTRVEQLIAQLAE